MTPSLPALSLSSTFTEVGALAAFVAVLGIALLALLCFSQAREIKRLREWAGRAPERAAEFERAAAQAAVRAQQGVAATPVPPRAQTPAAAGTSQPTDATRAPVPPPPATSIVPTPIPSPTIPSPAMPAPAMPAPALSGNDVAPRVAVSAPAAGNPAGAPGAPATPIPPATPPIPPPPIKDRPADRPAQPAVAAPSANAPQRAVAPSAGAPPPRDESGARPLAISATDRRSAGARGARDAETAGEEVQEPALSGRPLAPAQVAAGAAVSSPGTEAEASDGEARPSHAPATAAAAAAAASAGAHAPAAPQRSLTPTTPPQRPLTPTTPPERPRTPSAPPERPRTPPAPTRARGRTRAVAASAPELAPSRNASSLIDDLDAGAVPHAGSARLRGERPRASGGPSPRAIAVIVVGAVAAVLALMLATGVFSSGGSTPARTPAALATPGTSHARRASSKHHSTAGVAGAANPSEIAVGVLNGTETPLLAHHAASELVGKGYSKAVALVGKPEGSNQVSVVEYTSGHHADAAAVASSLGISTVQSIEGSTAALAGSATVAVVIGQDKASSGT